MKRKIGSVAPRLGSLIAGLCCAAGTACGPAASEQYLGEPMLSVRGHVVLEALTGGAPVEPALCFPRRDSTVAPEVTAMNLPSSAAQHFGGTSVRGLGTTHIVDVESRGEFPAEFNVDVYEPPPDSVLSRHFPGEPRMTWLGGSVCAVTEEHSGVSPAVVNMGARTTCSEPETPCQYAWLAFTQDSSRYYLETLDCAGSATLPADCTLDVEGDPALRYEYSEGIVGRASDAAIFYLADDALAGSYAAWTLGRPDGMPAGYYVYDTGPSGPSIAATTECAEQLGEQAIAQLNAELGVEYMFGGSQVFNELDDGGSPKPPPQAVQDRWNEITAQLAMENCPAPARVAVNAADDDLTFHIEQRLETVRDYAESILAP